MVALLRSDRSKATMLQLRRAPAPVSDRYRIARLTADTTAFSDALTIEPLTPTPHYTVSSTAHSTYAAARASSPADIACSW